MMSKTLAWTYGVFFLALAALGAFGGEEYVLGLFTTDPLRSAIHLGLGVFGMVCALGGAYSARLYLWAVGLLALSTSVAGFITGNVMGHPLGTADNYLHLAAGALGLYGVFAEDPHLGQDRIPITGRRGVSDFRQPQPRW
jgi:hypothetical protein